MPLKLNSVRGPFTPPLYHHQPKHPSLVCDLVVILYIYFELHLYLRNECIVQSMIIITVLNKLRIYREFHLFLAEENVVLIYWKAGRCGETGAYLHLK